MYLNVIHLASGPPLPVPRHPPILQHSSKAGLATLFCQAADEGSLISRQSQALAALKAVPGLPRNTCSSKLQRCPRPFWSWKLFPESSWAGTCRKLEILYCPENLHPQSHNSNALWLLQAGWGRSPVCCPLKHFIATESGFAKTTDADPTVGSSRG